MIKSIILCSLFAVSAVPGIAGLQNHLPNQQDGILTAKSKNSDSSFGSSSKSSSKSSKDSTFGSSSKSSSKDSSFGFHKIDLWEGNKGDNEAFKPNKDKNSGSVKKTDFWGEGKSDNDAFKSDKDKDSKTKENTANPPVSNGPQASDGQVPNPNGPQPPNGQVPNTQPK